MLAVAQVVEQALDRVQHELRIGVEVLVDRRADDDHDVLGVRTRSSGSMVASSRSVATRPLEHLVGVALSKNGILPARTVSTALASTSNSVDREAGVGEHETERQPHVATAADNHNIPRKRRAHGSAQPPVARSSLSVRCMIVPAGSLTEKGR